MENQANQADEPNSYSEQTPAKLPIQAVNGENKKPSGNAGKALISLLVLVLLVGLGVTGYLYSRQKSNNQQLNNEIASLKTQLTQQEKTEAILAEVPQTQKDEVANEGSSYHAKVGKFSLSLENPYVVIEQLDGGFEGGPATLLKIGEKIKSSGAISDSHFSDFKIRASRESISEFGHFVNNRNKESSSGATVKQEQNIQIDGVSAEVYTYNDFFNYKTVYFQKGKIFYIFDIVDDKKDSTKKLDAVIKGFKFN